MKKKPASPVGPMKVLDYAEWERVDDFAVVEGVVFREAEVALVWSWDGQKSSGTARTTDGKHFEGQRKENPPGDDYGVVSFTLYRAVDGEALLIGKWYSESPTYGDEGDFFLRVAPQKPD